MKRFLVPGAWKAGDSVRLDPDESRHAGRVMRLGPGDRILISDGAGREAEAELLSLGKDGAEARVLALRKKRPERPALELWQALLKGPRMDWLVEKATELGVSSIRPLSTSHSVAGERKDRWQRIAHAALKQSGSPSLPAIHDCATLAAALDSLPDLFRGVVLDPEAPVGLAAQLRNGPESKLVILAIGPEGGFSAEELALMKGRGFVPASLSRQILRGETAAISACSVAFHALEFPQAPAL